MSLSSTRARRLLQIGPLPPDLEKQLQSRYQVDRLWLEGNPEHYLADRQGYFDGAVTMSRHGCSADVMQALGAGRVLACFGVGAERIDLKAATTCGVQVSVTPDVLTDCVADLALALILVTSRNIIAADRFVQNGDWVHGSFPLANRASGKRLGIIGLGRIGRAIARRAQGFDMDIRYFGRRVRPDVPYTFETNLHDLASWSDFLVLSCTGGAQTHHLVSADTLAALGKKGVLINIARGSVVDEDALVNAVVRGELGGVGLDVVANEPHVPAELLGHDRVVVLPHIAASTQETRQVMEQLVLDNLDAFFSTRQVLTPPQ